MWAAQIYVAKTKNSFATHDGDVRLLILSTHITHTTLAHQTDHHVHICIHISMSVQNSADTTYYLNLLWQLEHDFAIVLSIARNMS